MDKENLNGVPEEETETPAEELEQADAEDAAVQDETADSNGDIVQEEAEEPVLCSVCGQNEAAEGSEYCIECETAMLKRRIPFMGWLAGIAALGVSLLAFLVAIISLVPSGYVILGDSYAKKGNWHMAYEVYYDSIMETANFNSYANEMLGTNIRFISVGEKVNEHIVDAVANYYSPIDAYYFAQNYLGSEADNLPFMQKYKKANDENYAVFTSLSETFNSALEGKIKADAALKEIEALRGTEGLNNVYVDYYKYALAYELGEPAQAQLEFLKSLEATAEASGEDYGWIYFLPMAQALYDTGEYDEAIEYVDKIIAVNKTSFEAYELKMKAQLSLGDEEGAGKTVDEFKETGAYSELAYYPNLLEIEYLRSVGKYAEAKALCVEAAALQEGVSQDNAMINLIYGMESKLLTTSEFSRQSALISMTEGEYADAFGSMMDAYSLESQYAYYMQYSAALNDPGFYGTLYLSAKLLSTSDQLTEDNTADVEYVLSMFEAGTMPTDIEAIINGEKTVEEVLTKGAFDLA